jgi:iron complex transport system ATP-binding protein
MILEGRQLTIGYSDRTVGTNLNVALNTGEVLALLGPNGGGKTTLLKTLLGILKPQAGEVAIGDRSLAAISLRERARLIAYVPQVHVPTFAFTVETVVLMGRTAHGNLFSAPSAHDRTVAARVLGQFGISHLAARPYTMISGGERQLVLLARVGPGAAIRGARRADREPRLRKPGQGDARDPRARRLRPRRAVHHP